MDPLGFCIIEGPRASRRGAESSHIIVEQYRLISDQGKERVLGLQVAVYIITLETGSAGFRWGGP